MKCALLFNEEHSVLGTGQMVNEELSNLHEQEKKSEGSIEKFRSMTLRETETPLGTKFASKQKLNVADWTENKSQESDTVCADTQEAHCANKFPTRQSRGALDHYELLRHRKYHRTAHSPHGPHSQFPSLETQLQRTITTNEISPEVDVKMHTRELPTTCVENNDVPPPCLMSRLRSGSKAGSDIDVKEQHVKMRSLSKLLRLPRLMWAVATMPWPH